MLTMSLSRRWPFADRRIPYYVEFGLLLATSLIVEFALLLAVGTAPFGWLLFLHFMLLLGLGAWLWSIHRRELNVEKPALFVVAVCLLGPFGAFGALVMFAVMRVFPGTPTTPQCRHDLLFPKRQVDPVDQLCLQLSAPAIQTPLQSRSFSQIVSSGTFAEKAEIVALLARQPRPCFANILKQALNDTEPAIRVQAASVQAQWQDKMTRRWLELKKRVSEYPENAANHYELAKHLDEYAYYAILDHEENQRLRHEALQSYQYCLKYVNIFADCGPLTGRILIRLGRFHEATLLFESLMEQKILHVPSWWYAECLFRLNRIAELRLILSKLEYIAETKNPTLQAINRFWTVSK